ncbi:tRNA (adenosine(37)-N6)-dimethylallyltransferase MiaA [Candidatus Uhrbacteria bacterium]|nr:tRNA (adenosine(37)-N6)-dimethylallyltransferase MiaA [Candidatus Uhrbacteria bacterium]
MRHDRKTSVVVVVGPTGSGKTDLGILLAQRFHGAVIAADSRTVYRGMDIGTAKAIAHEEKNASLHARSSRGAASDEGPPTDVQSPQCPTAHARSSRGAASDERPPTAVRSSKRSTTDTPILVRGIPHYCIDIRNPDQPYSAAAFVHDAARCIRRIARQGRLPIVVGGTGLYVEALVGGLDLPDVPPNAALRAALAAQSVEALSAQYAALDPVGWSHIDQANPRRLIRAIEVSRATGRPYAELRKRRSMPFSFLQIGVDRSLPVLQRRIVSRAHAMLRQGLIAETEALAHQYGMIEPLRGMGYREVIAWLQQDAALRAPRRELGQCIARATYRYARKQLAWFRRDPTVRWVHSSPQAVRMVRLFLADRG